MGSENPEVWKKRKLDNLEEDLIEGEESSMGKILSNGYGLFTRLDYQDFSDPKINEAVRT